ncbi:MAG TPA: CarD family transcriptional regulator, partial [Bacteroidia bacterium]|nr:CarD family transcriptional regulator [Bacteroidia bacterium]
MITEISGARAAGIQLRGLAGSAGAFFASAVLQRSSQSHLFILGDKEEAAYFLNDLEGLLGVNMDETGTRSSFPVLFFPASYRRPYQVEDTDNANVLLRAEVLDRIRREKKVAVVTYPGALAEKVVTRQLLEKNTLQLKRGEKISIAFVTDLLNEYGFERNDYVYDAGQYAVRGGIVDVFSFANEHPYRIEFFGDDVESIRTFDPLTQLSVKNLDRLTIIPNVQGKLLTESRESFFEYFFTARHDGQNVNVVWISDIETTGAVVQKEFEAAEKAFAERTEESPVRHLSPAEQFIDEATFRETLRRFHVIEYGSRFILENARAITFSTHPQPAFRKNFDLLTQELAKNSAAGMKNIVFTDSAKQAERLHSIFTDIGRKLDYSPIVHSVHEGFSDTDLKIACYTDHQVFERYHRFRLRDGFQRKKEAMTIKELRGLNPGDYVVHIDHGVGRFGGL